MMKIPVLMLSVLLVGCQSTPKLSPEQQLQQQQQQAMSLGAKFSRELDEAGQRYPDADYQAYLQQLLTQLTSAEERQQYDLQAFVTNDPLVNAFALPNGHIYLNLGLVSVLQNRAELAFILAHEIEHVTQQHSRESREHRSKTVVSAHVLDLLTMGTGLAYFPAIGALSHHSIKAELSADLGALERWQQAGFSHPDIAKLFSRINNGEVPRDDFFAYQSHPDNDQRTEQLTPLQQSAESAIDARFQAALPRLRQQNFELKLKQRRFLLAEQDIERFEQFASPVYRAEVHLGKAIYPQAVGREQAWLQDSNVDNAIGEVKAQRDEHFAAAQDLLEGVLEDDPLFVRSRRALGDLYRAQQQPALAKQAYQQYLQYVDAGPQQAYINAIIKKL